MMPVLKLYIGIIIIQVTKGTAIHQNVMSYANWFADEHEPRSQWIQHAMTEHPGGAMVSCGIHDVTAIATNQNPSVISLREALLIAAGKVST